MKELLEIARRIDVRDTKNHVQNIYVIFQGINEMDGPAIMAFSQTFFFYYSDMLDKVDEQTSEKLDKIRDAIWARMIYIASHIPPDARHAVVLAFSKSCADWWDMSIRQFVEAKLM